MADTVITPLSMERKKRIKLIVKIYYGFEPQDSDISWIDEVLRNHYLVLHDQHIILELVAHEISKPLLKHRDRLGSITFEEIWLNKTIFRYLMYASMCFRAGISSGTIALCRTAIEAGLRERLAAEMTIEPESHADRANLVKQKLYQLRNLTIVDLLCKLEERGVITNADFGRHFKSLKLSNQSARKILDKFIHGDIAWIVDFAADRGLDTTVIGAKKCTSGIQNYC